MNILHKLRTLVPGPRASSPNEYGFVLGAHMRPCDDKSHVEAVEEPAVFTPAVHGHLYLTGAPGTGKTVLLRALADKAAQVMDVHAVDSWGTLDKETALQPSGAASISFTAAECAEMLEGVLTEVRRRVQQCTLEGVASFTDLENPPGRILVILDDTRHLLVEEEYSCDGHPHRAAKLRSVECIEEIAENARLAGVTFAFASQWPADESGMPAKVIEHSVSTLKLKTDRYGIEWSDHQALIRRGLYKPIGGPESWLVMEDR